MNEKVPSRTDGRLVAFDSLFLDVCLLMVAGQVCNDPAAYMAHHKKWGCCLWDKNNFYLQFEEIRDDGTMLHLFCQPKMT
jgi:hypothetical protein